MESITQKIITFVFIFGFFTQTVSAQVVSDFAYIDPSYTQNSSFSYNLYDQDNYNNSILITQLLQQIQQLQQQINFLNNNSFNVGLGHYDGSNNNGQYTFTSTSSRNNNLSNNNDPDVDTQSARDIEEDSAELRGEVDMNDFRNGIVFFVYGQDEDKVEDVEDDYDEYNDVRNDKEDDEFEVIRVDNDLDNSERYEKEVDNLEEDEEYYFIICVEYEDRDNDETLECGDVEDFETDDENSNTDEPDVETDNANDIEDNRAELRGSVDMNDFNNGRVFFVWGEDEDEVEDVDNEDRYNEIDQKGDDIRKQVVRSIFSGNDNFELDVFNLGNNTRHYFRICVEYEENRNDEILECGKVKEFKTDR